ncbi:MAG: asparaginase, partial [Acidobacteria bacterium]|nr:asparaginase [Acidobacteriota bacterium]
ELRASGESPTPLHNNCSGKHAGMLLASRLLDLPSASYNDIEHPLQRQILQVLADFAGLESGEIGLAIDGCGVPAFHLPLHRTAFAFARLTAMSSDATEPPLPRYADAAREIYEAMTRNPDYVAGAWSITTPLMKAFEGRLLAKEGAEGFYAMGLDAVLSAPILERLGLEEGPSIGIAVKVSDGSMTRGRDPAVLRTLEQLGLSIDTEMLATYRDRRITNCAGIEVGRIRSEFELDFF